MDILICAALSLVETLAIILLKELLTNKGPLQIFVLFFLTQYALAKIYQRFMSPVFFSRLRHLPGPTVREFRYIMKLCERELSDG
jgi:hypothetical protein